MKLDDPSLQLFFDGDRIGAPAESMPGSTLSYERMIARQHEYPNGTDESDSVRLFVEYANGYQWQGDYDAFATGWARYVTAHHACTSYGKTWRCLFALVKHVEKNTRQPITHAKLIEMGKDWNSCGNGCLALAYPTWQYAKEVGADAHRLAGAVTEISHAHPLAQRCVAALVDYFASGGKATFDADLFPPPGREWQFTQTASGCLWAACRCSQGETQEDVIRRAAQIGGDTDSHLSLSMLLWGVRMQPKWQELRERRVAERMEFIELSRCPLFKAKAARFVYNMTRDEAWKTASHAYMEESRVCEKLRKEVGCIFDNGLLGLTPADSEYLRRKYKRGRP